jgi:hypothetical protein
MEDLMEKVYIKRPELRGILKATEHMDHTTSLYVFEDTFGKIRTTIADLLRGETPGIMSACDKPKYFLKKFEYFQPIKFKKMTIKSNYLHSKLPLIVEDEYGEMLCTPTTLLSDRLQGIDTAIDKTKYYLAKNKHIIHDNVDFKKFQYITKKTPTVVTCKKHGDFKTHPDRLERGIGCFHCGVEMRIGKQKRKFPNTALNTGLYIMQLTSSLETFYKVGISANVQRRSSNFKKVGYKVEIIYFNKLGKSEALKCEKLFLKDFRSFKIQPTIKFEGDTECISVNPLDYYYEVYK